MAELGPGSSPGISAGITPVRVLVDRPTRPQTMTMTTGWGWSTTMYSTPPRFTYSDVAVFGTIEREGRKAITRWVSPGLRKLSFTHVVASLDYQGTVENMLRAFTDTASSGMQVRFSGGSGAFEQPCWWFIKNLQVNVLQRGINNEPSRVELQWDLEEREDVNSAASVVYPPPPPPAPPAPPPATRTHTVAPGDTLWGIAARYLGNGARWPEVFNINKDRISNPNLIYPGQVFRIP